MNVVVSVSLLVAAVVLLTWSITATLIAPPLRLDSRDVLVIAEGLAGLALALLAARRFIALHRKLRVR